MPDFDALVRWFKGAGDGVLVALSGGVDSALVALAASEALGNRAVAVTADYRTLSADELDSARSVCDEIGIRHMMIKYNELENPEFVKNNNDRCYHCRMELGGRLLDLAGGMEGSWIVVDGTNLDDLGEYRPGIEAMRKNGVRSPLAEAGFDKQAVRNAARAAGLSVHDRPSNACLASRIPWGERITAERLARIDKGERMVRRMSGARQVRVRDVGGLARIEVEPEAIPAFDEPYSGTRGSSAPDDRADAHLGKIYNHNNGTAARGGMRLPHDSGRDASQDGPRLLDEVKRQLVLIGFDNVVLDPDGYGPGKANGAVSD